MAAVSDGAAKWSKLCPHFPGPDEQGRAAAMLGMSKKPMFARASAAPAPASAALAPKAEAEPLVLGLFDNDDFANYVRYGLTGIVVVAGFWLSGATVKDVVSTPKAVLSAVWNWGIEKD